MNVYSFQLKVEGPVYKPVEVISSYGHLVGDGFASALNKAVNSVFTLTAKMACKMFCFLTPCLNFGVSSRFVNLQLHQQVKIVIFEGIRVLSIHETVGASGGSS